MLVMGVSTLMYMYILKYNYTVDVLPANLMFHPCCDVLFIEQE